MSSRTLNLTETIYQYLLNTSLREHPAQVALREATRTHPYATMQISPEQGQFMAMLVRLIGARRTIEVGVFTGYSALTVALALPEGGNVLACDISDDFTRVGVPHWQVAGVAHKIDLQLVPAVNTLEILWGQRGLFFVKHADPENPGIVDRHSARRSENKWLEMPANARVSAN